MKTLNLGILAHVDAGKTSLTERLLYNSGVIFSLGNVDTGTTHTDSLELEQKRGITIKSAVVSFRVGDLKINLIDTPGHPDFIAEVERALSVLDAVVLVISAVEGVQPQTRILMRALKRMCIPTIIFINKVDRMGARSDELVEEIKAKLFTNVIAMNTVIEIGTHNVRVDDRTKDALFTKELMTILAENDDRVLESLVNGHSTIDIEQSLVAQIGNLQLCPIYFGSAIKDVGVSALMNALATYFYPATASTSNTLSAVAFKIERGTRDEKVVYVRVYSGSLHLRKPIVLSHTVEHNQIVQSNAKITAMQLFQDGKTIETKVAHACDIVKVWGLSDCAIDDYIGEAPSLKKSIAHFARPTLEVVVSPVFKGDSPKLFSALEQISEQDPFIEIHRPDHGSLLSIRICGEVQKEVIEDTLQAHYGVEVVFSETTSICIERPSGNGESIEIGKQGDPYLGTVGLKIEPAPIGSGVKYQRANDVLGTMPEAFFAAVEETVYSTLSQGLYGWQVTDCVVTLMRTGYWPRQSHAHASFDKSMSSTAGDFRNMTPLALMAALKQARTNVYEPMNKFELELPADTLSTVMQNLSSSEVRLNAPPALLGDSVRLEGLLPARRTFEFERSVPDLTNGEGSFTTERSEYQAVQGVTPTKERTDNNPLNREEYLKRISERI